MKGSQLKLGGMMNFNTVDKLSLQNKTVFLRLDLNVPLDGSGNITDDTRIVKALPTLKHILGQTNKIVIASHLGRPKGKVVPGMSLEPVGRKLYELLGVEIAFVKDYVQAPADQLLQQLGKNRVILLENLRFYSQETENDTEFAQILAKGIDYYVSDAFGALHRAHASVAALPGRFPKERRAIGFLVSQELKALDMLKQGAQAPYTVILGGSKVSDKVGVILNLVNQCNHVLIGGAMAYSFLRYKGTGVGSSLVEANVDGLISSIYESAEARKVSIHLPIDHVCAKNVDSEEAQIASGDIPAGLAGFDIGPATLDAYRKVIVSSKTIFWNGPLGVFERPAFRAGTSAVAKAVAGQDCYSVAGGGDSLAAIKLAGVADQFTHLSTGGGASLEYLEGKTLPGLKVLSR